MSQPLQQEDIYQVLSSHFPKQNDFLDTDYKMEHSYLLYFGINTKDKLEAFIAKHRGAVMEIDSIMLEEDEEDDETPEEIAYGRDFGDMSEAVGDYCLANNLYYSYPELLMVAMDIEFEDRFVNHMDKTYYSKNIEPEFRVYNIPV